MAKRILLVDDDDINNFLSEEIIGHYSPGSKITSAKTVTQALEFLQERNATQQPLPDIIMVDINMPWLNGWDFIEQFESLDITGREKIKLYIYTSSVYFKDIERGRSYASVRNILSKPLTDEMLEEVFGDH